MEEGEIQMNDVMMNDAVVVRPVADQQFLSNQKAVIKQMVGDELIDTESRVKAFKEDHPLATRKEVSIMAKQLWASEKFAQLNKLHEIGSGTQRGTYLINWFTPANMYTLIKYIEELPPTAAAVKMAEGMKVYNYSTLKYVKKKQFTVNHEFHLLTPVQILQAVARLSGANDEVINQFQQADTINNGLAALKVLDAVIKAGLKEISFEHLNAMSQPALNLVGYLIAQGIRRPGAEYQRGSIIDQADPDSIGNYLKTLGTIGVVGVSVSESLIQCSAVVSSYNHWKGRGYSLKYMSYQASFRNEYYDTMIIMILRGEKYNKDSIQWKNGGDPIFILSRGDTVSVPRGSISVNDFVLVVCLSADAALARLKTFEISHWVSSLFKINVGEVPVVYNRAKLPQKPYFDPVISTSKGVLGWSRTTDCMIRLYAQHPYFKMSGNADMGLFDKMLEGNHDNFIDNLIDSATDSGGDMYKRRQAASRLIKFLAANVDLQMGDAVMKRLNSFKEAMAEFPSSNMVSALNSVGLSTTDYAQFKAGPQYKAIYSRKRIRTGL